MAVYEHYFEGPHLRVLKPRTKNGLSPKIGHDGRIEYKEVLLPLSAKADQEQRNLKLPDALKMKIDVVGAQEPITRPEPKPAPAKPGPKPKQNDLD